MATPPTVAVNLVQPSEEFPSPGLPTLFADGILNVALSASNAKFYLFRQDPSLTGSQHNKVQPIAQIVMPLEAFVTAAAFFQANVERLIANGNFPRERADQLRQLTEQSLQ